jgi:CubicO group peptidase (beta-lactamase class C family)
VDTGWPAAGGGSWRASRAAPRAALGAGTQAGYHLASSWFILGELVRRLDGRPFETYVRDEIFAPLDASTAGSACRLNASAPTARGSRRCTTSLRRTRGRTLVENDSRARLAWSLAWRQRLRPDRELARLYQMLAPAHRGPAPVAPGDSERSRAHRVGMIDATFRARLDWGLGVIANSAHYGEPGMPYGYGPHAGPRTFGHSGARSSTAFCDPEAGLVVALAVNGMPGDELHRLRFERLTAALYRDLGLAPLAPLAPTPDAI